MLSRFYKTSVHKVYKVFSNDDNGDNDSKKQKENSNEERGKKRMIREWNDVVSRASHVKGRGTATLEGVSTQPSSPLPYGARAPAFLQLRTSNTWSRSASCTSVRRESALSVPIPLHRTLSR